MIPSLTSPPEGVQLHTVPLCEFKVSTPFCPKDLGEVSIQTTHFEFSDHSFDRSIFVFLSKRQPCRLMCPSHTV